MKFGADVLRRDIDEQRHTATLEMEQLLIGAVFAKRDGLGQARAIVRPDDFIEPLHAHLFAMMCDRADANEPVNLTVMRHAIMGFDLGTMSVSDYLTTLMRHGASTDAGEAARSVRRARQIREAEDAAASLAEELGTSSVVQDPTPSLRTVIDRFDAIVTENAVHHLQRTTVGQAARSVMTTVDGKRSGRIPPGLSFGLPSLDRITTGMHPGQLIVLAGRPGMGKTALGMHMAGSVAHGGSGVLYVTLEMGADELTQRLLSSMSYRRSKFPVPYRNINDAKCLSDEDVHLLTELTEEADGIPLTFEPQPGVTVTQIAARARQFMARNQGKREAMRVLVVDHIGLIKPTSRYEGNRVNEIAEITGSLKSLARELDITVIALSQLSRGVESRPIAERRPIASDLRDSGSIEQDADVILAVYREQAYLERIPEPTEDELDRLQQVRNTLEIEVLKNRQGPTDRTRFFCDMGCNFVGELAR